MEVRSVDEALKAFQKKHFDLILLDYRLPQRDGIELILELRSELGESRTAIVMMSTSEEEELVLTSLRSGAHDFIVKADITAPRLRRAILNAQTRFELEQRLHSSYQRVKQLAERDSLTGLANRYLFEESLRMAVKNNDRGQNKLALILIDLDHFKFTNDNYGHDVGDALLRKVATRINSCLRGHELFARLGGDEFAITLSGLHQTRDASRVARRILKVMEKPFNISGANIHSGASIGIAIYPDTGNKPEDLFKFADIAMYRAKKSGRNQMCFFEKAMQEEFLARYHLENELRQALAQQQFELHYQPVFNPNDNSLTGFEALIRWPNGKTLHYPDHFITVAEESRLILDIGSWVIEEAISQLAEWNQSRSTPLTMAINLSVVQLADTHLPDMIKRCLQRHQVAPAQIEFELTETALLDNMHEKIQVIHAISDMGCHIALDDFGTGFSSISHLQNFPIHTVKLDRSIMPGDLSNKRALSLIQGLVKIIHSLELEAVAEGTEQLAQLALCRDMQVDRVQGYYFSRALPSEEASRTYLN